MWANGAKESSLTYLRQFSSNLSRDLQAPDDTHTHPWIARERKNQLSKLLARCFFKQGQWQIQAQSSEGWVATDANTIINCYVMATQHDPDWYKAWHTWALANLDVITYLEGQPENRFNDSPPDNLAKHVVQAIEGLFRSVSLRSTDTLQDTLRILTLWFKFGGHSEVGHVIGSGFNKVGVDNWLEVIPQVRLGYMRAKQYSCLFSDHCSYSNASHYHPSSHPNRAYCHRSRASSGDDLPTHCRVQVL